MTMGDEGQRFLLFGDFRLDFYRHELWRGGELVALRSSAFDVLAFLAQHRGETIDKEELFRALWAAEQGDLNVVEQAVSEIRKALGDDAKEPVYIKTIPRKGYVFIAEIVLAPNPEHPLETITSETQPASSAPSTARPDEETARRLGGRRTVFVLAGIGIVIMLTVALMRSLRAPFHLSPPIPITRSANAKLAPLLTDGSRLYFTEIINGRYHVSQMPVSGGEPVELPIPLTNPELCDISPDGSKLLLRTVSTSRSEDNAPLWIYPLVSGKPYRAGNLAALDAGWSPDEKQIVYTQGHDIFITSGFDASASRRITPTEGRPWWVRWSPDRKRIRFTVSDFRRNTHALWEVGLDGSNLHPLFSKWSKTPSECCGAWINNRNQFVFQSAHDRDIVQIWLERGLRILDFRRQPIQITDGPINYRGPLPSKDGRRLLVRGTANKAAIVRFEESTGNFVMLSTGFFGYMMSFTHDASRVAYISLPENQLLYGGTNEQRRYPLTSLPLQAALPRWARDGKQIVFMGRYPGKPWQIFVTSTEGEVAKEILPADENQADPDWSSDGKRIVFGRVLGLGEVPTGTAIFLVDVNTKKVSTIAGSEGMFSPRWSPTDENLLAAIDVKNFHLKLYDDHSKSWTVLTEIAATYPNWSTDGKRILFLHQDKAAGNSIYQVNIKTGVVSEITALQGVQQPSFVFGTWIGIGPRGEPLAATDLSTQDLYAFDVVP